MDPSAGAAEGTRNGLDAVIATLVKSAPDAAEAVEALHIVLGMAPHPPTDVDPGSRLVEDLGYDSLRLIELSVALEERFGARFDPEAAVQIKTLYDATRYVASIAAAESCCCVTSTKEQEWLSR